MDNEQSTPQKQIDSISQDVSWYIDRFQRSANWYRWQYFVTSISTLVLSAIITIIAGWSHPPELLASYPGINAKNAILVLGAVTTIVSGWGLFFSPKKSWLIFQNSSNQLRALRTKIKFLDSSLSTVSDETSSEILAEYQSTMAAQNNAWLELRESTTPPTQDTRG